MPYSTIIVQRPDGSSVEGAKVSLGFDRVFSGGVTHSEHTDRHGRAIIEHKNTGQADVYVNGSKVDSFHSPGKCVVTL